MNITVTERLERIGIKHAQALWRDILRAQRREDALTPLRAERLRMAAHALARIRARKGTP